MFWNETPPWTQEVNLLYIRSSEEVLDVFWTSYVRLIYVLCPGGLWNISQIHRNLTISRIAILKKTCEWLLFIQHLLAQSQQWKQQNRKIWSKVTTKTPQQRHWRFFGVSIVNFELISLKVGLIWCNSDDNLFLSIFIIPVSSFDFSKCSKTYKKIGCYEDSNHDMVMLENYRDPKRKDFGALSKIFWKNFEEVVHR